jgi:TRAP-type mannitol/chloroaromatic compound transport system permease small subunit
MAVFWMKLAKGIDRLNESIGKTVSWLNFILMILVCFDVINRYLFNYTASWINELEWHFFALIFLLGAGYAFKNDQHVRVDLFYTNFSIKDKARVDFWGSLIFLIPWSFLLCYFAVFFAWESYLDGEVSAEPGGLPARFLIKFAIVAGMFLLFLQGVATMIHSLATILDRGETEVETETPELNQVD